MRKKGKRQGGERELEKERGGKKVENQKRGGKEKEGGKKGGNIGEKLVYRLLLFHYSVFKRGIQETFIVRFLLC